LAIARETVFVLSPSSSAKSRRHNRPFVLIRLKPQLNLAMSKTILTSANVSASWIIQSKTSLGSGVKLPTCQSLVSSPRFFGMLPSFLSVHYAMRFFGKQSKKMATVCVAILTG
jgi:hypothetical protein